MLIPRYWARATGEEQAPDGRRLAFACWQWSERSLAEAHARAREAAERVGKRIRWGEPLPSRYAYGSRPPREEILDELRDRDGVPRAILTRNAYGAVVLNAAGALFVDVDLPETSDGSRLARAVRSLFGTRPAPPSDPPALATLRALIGSRPGWGVRVYSTAAGLRYLATHGPFDPAAGDTAELLTALGCDPKYVQLCRAQRSFRARLTPKPWRCGVRAMPGPYPFEDAAAAERARAWVAAYDRAAARYATCTLHTVVGEGRVHPALAEIVALHDERARVGHDLPLA